MMITNTIRTCGHKSLTGRHLLSWHHAAGVPLFAEAHVLALRHEVVVNYVIPLGGILAERRSDIGEQLPVLVVGTGAYPLV